MLQRAVLLAQSAEEASQRTSTHGKQNSAELDKYLALERQYKRHNLAVPQSLKDYIQTATQEQKEAQQKAAAPDATEQLDQKAAQDDSAQALQLFQQLRAALGLPPLPAK
jgi:uncharacterized protein YkwD